MPEQMTREAEIELQEVEDALTLLRSDEWKTYVKFLRARALRLQDKANKAVVDGDLVQAKINLALMEDSLKQAEVFKKEVLIRNEQLRKEGIK